DVRIFNIPSDFSTPTVYLSGLQLEYGTPNVYNNSTLIADNLDIHHGKGDGIAGGITGGGPLTLSNSIIHDNIGQPDGDYGASGGGLSVGDATITNVQIYDNHIP